MLTFKILANIMFRIIFKNLKLNLDTFDEYVDDLIASDTNLLKGELDLLIMQHLFNSVELECFKDNLEQDNDSLAA